MKDEMVALLDRLQQLEMDSQTIMTAVPGSVSRTKPSDLVDAGWAARECAKICETLRKAFASRQQIIGRYLALHAGQEALKGSTVELEGEFATGTADAEQKPKIPDSGTPEHTLLMRWLGVPEDLIK